eukprot:scaffold8353_cov138-Cylindrotheca_fusiformis.AAC.28
MDNNNSIRRDAMNTDSSSKRAALAGQWSTPPLPVFPSGYGQAHHPPPQQHQHQQPAQQSFMTTESPMQNIQAPTSIPNNSEEYAKALQEAYRKGAEAAALMAQQQQQNINMPTAISCPNFSTGPHAQPPPQQQPMVMTAASEESAYIHHVHPAPTHVTIPDPLSSSMPPPPPPAAASHPHQQQHLHHSHHHHTQHQQLPPQPPQQHDYNPSTKPTASSKAAQARSVSLPDMSAYAARAEEEKRQKRLARNRASARLRRLRKKNLVSIFGAVETDSLRDRPSNVDAYETEVGILEKTLKQLQAHEWGEVDDHKALLEALGMERGQQAIRPEQRGELIKDILSQQLKQVELLRQAQLEQQVLAMLAEDDQDELSKELQEVLQLSDSQKEELRGSSQGLQKEIEALETVASSLQAMVDNEWLLNEGVQNIVDQFTSILHKNQLSKFLLWTDANVDAIDQLDHVQVQPLQAAPIFTFGVETSPVDED